MSNVISTYLIVTRINAFILLFFSSSLLLEVRLKLLIKCFCVINLLTPCLLDRHYILIAHLYFDIAIIMFFPHTFTRIHLDCLNINLLYLRLIGQVRLSNSYLRRRVARKRRLSYLLEINETYI